MYHFESKHQYENILYLRYYYEIFTLIIGFCLTLNFCMPKKRGLLFGFTNYKIIHIAKIFNAVDARMLVFGIYNVTISAGVKFLEIMLTVWLIEHNNKGSILLWFFISLFTKFISNIMK